MPLGLMILIFVTMLIAGMPVAFIRVIFKSCV